MTPAAPTTGHGIKLSIGAGAAIFLIGTIFWAGATYQRIGSIESRLASINESIEKLALVTSATTDHGRRLDKIEERVERDERERLPK